ncbi:MAG: phospholipid carrier-dependent glycosyltransferase [Oscillochloris sp.]|nr:phospholipid carrier-dependent glycosyltransferase [Oscillochloris sp.]
MHHEKREAQKGNGKRERLVFPFTVAFSLCALTMLGLALRLLAWRWHEFYALGGDEREYFEQAIQLLRDHQYVELRLMRPPLYPLFLAGCIYLVDSLVQNLRLIQALISAATVPLVYLLTREVARRDRNESRIPALLAALLCALSYTLAANATELLTEALFLCGLTLVLYLLLRSARTGGIITAGLAGLTIGALCLLRSVALPLLPLGAVWLLMNAQGKRQKAQAHSARWVMQLCLFLFTFCLVLLPWTARNHAIYGGLILIDTTGAENLWLDNDPAGRETVKAQLYAMGEDRLARQKLSMQRGIAVIGDNPARFAAKGWSELKKLFALEFSDDMLARRAIWVPPAEVVARLLLGDGVWLLLLLAGAFGLGRAVGGRGQEPGAKEQATNLLPPAARLWSANTWSDPVYLLLPWTLYVALTTLIFHVELRYRLPLYPALLPYAGMTLAHLGRWRVANNPRWPAIGGLLAAGLCLALTLLHTNYPTLAWRLGWKHWNLAQAEAALADGNVQTARQAADAALARDDGSALARVDLARASLLAGDKAGAHIQLNEATSALPAHPYAHLLRGDLLRQQGDDTAAQAELIYETRSLEDLQVWAWERFVGEPPTQLNLGNGLDLGFVRGFHSVAKDEEGFRWTKGEAQLRLTAPAGATALQLQAASGRPDGSPVELRVMIDDRDLGTLQISAEGGAYRVVLPARISNARIVVVRLDSSTFTPRTYDRASPDGRTLGIKLDAAELVIPEP